MNETMTNEVTCDFCSGIIQNDNVFLSIGDMCYHKLCVEIIKSQSTIKDNWITMKEKSN